MNVPASVRQRLLNLARARGDEFQRVLTQFALERLLFRLSQSSYAGQFVVKGAFVFLLWIDEPHRRTRDLDLLARGEPSSVHVAALFRDICTMTVEADGLEFDPADVVARNIRENNPYKGIRVSVVARLGTARVPLQGDICFGGSVVPHTLMNEFPTLLAFPAPRLLTYPRETVVAEKLCAMVELDMANSRMKDFFDVWTLSMRFDFDGRILADAIDATFARRKVALPENTPIALRPEFWSNESKQRQWAAFLAQTVTRSESWEPLEEIGSAIHLFVWPVLDSLHARRQFQIIWHPGGPWREPFAREPKLCSSL